MRNIFVRGLAVVAMLASVAAVSESPAVSQDLIQGFVDVGVTIESKPTTVSPPGELALFAATVTNQGILPAASTLTVTFPAGSFYRDDLSTASCSGSGTVATCPVPEQTSGASDLFEVVASTPTTAGLHVTTAEVETVGIVEPLEYTANNTATATTDVKVVNEGVAAGLVEGGDTLSLELADGRKYVLTVPESVPGVIVRRLAGQSGTGKLCGLGPCGNGFVIDFVPHPYFKAEDPTNPLESDRTYGPQDPCRGLGACADVYYAKSDSAPALAQMPFCPGAGPGGEVGSGDAIPSPCLNQKYKQSGVIWFDVRLLSTDPIDLPPLNNGR